MRPIIFRGDLVRHDKINFSIIYNTLFLALLYSILVLLYSTHALYSLLGCFFFFGKFLPFAP